MENARLNSADDPFATGRSCRCCEIPGCVADGLHRAPKGRDRLNEYYWFCLEHVREYNKKWDFCAGLTIEEIEGLIRRDTTWQRPSWPLGGWRTRERDLRDFLRRNFCDDATRKNGDAAGAGAGAGAGPGPGGGAGAGPGGRSRPEMARPEADALRLLGLEPPVEFAQVKARYRDLVKRHHPDANGGDKASEERLKLINQAYSTLKIRFGAN